MKFGIRQKFVFEFQFFFENKDLLKLLLIRIILENKVEDKLLDRF